MQDGLLHHLAELGVIPRRQVRRDPAAEADDLDVRDLRSRWKMYSSRRSESIIGSPPDSSHIADFRMRTDVLERRVVLVERNLLRVADFPAAVQNRQ